MVAKCSPPLRPREDVEDLWRTVLDGHVDLVGSDHSPSPPELKQGEDAFAAWGGIAGGQTLLRMLLTEGPPRGLALEAIATLAAAAPARRFGLAGKGSIAPGADADLVLVDLASRGRAAERRAALPPPSQPVPLAQAAGPGRPHDRTRMHGCPRWGYCRSSGGTHGAPGSDVDGGEVVGVNVTVPGGTARKENRV